MLPESNRKPYDMYEVIRRIVDDGDYFDLKPQWAKTIITCLARFGGRPAGIVANQPQAARRDPRQRLGRQGGALHQPLQRLRDPARVPGGRARIHGRDQGRGGGDHPARRQDALRDRERDRPEDHGDRAQGLRRRLLRDVRPRLRARPDRRLALGRDQRDGRRGRRRDRLPQAGRGGGGPGRQARGADRRPTARSSTSTSPPATT